MIIRARSPLFVFHLLATLVTGASFGMRLEIDAGRESFINQPAFAIVNQATAIGLVLGIISLVALGAMEFAIHKGWDPPFLRVRLYGAEVLAVDEQGFSRVRWRVTVRHPQGDQHSYLAEADEAKLLQPGDICRLDVFGQHLVGIRVLQPADQQSAAPTTTQTALRSLRFGPASMFWIARAFMLIGFPFFAIMIGSNLLPLLYREDVVQFTRRRWRPPTFQTMYGDDAIWANLVFVAPALVGFLALSWFWLRGWDAEELNYQLSEASRDMLTIRRNRLL